MQKRQRKASAEGKAPSKAQPKTSSKTPSKTTSKVALPLAAAVKSFIGHLEGTGKAKHTIDAYRFDLLSFGEFLLAHRGKPTLDLKLLNRKDLERFHEWLKSGAQKTNTRRRKLMTVRKLMHYLTARGKLNFDIAEKLPAPEKIERVPATINLIQFREKTATLPKESHLQLRNLALLGLLSDTGCSVSEAAKLRWSALDLKNFKVSFHGKAERDGVLNPSTAEAFTNLHATPRVSGSTETDELCFVGFNRYGPMRIGKKALGITPRGIEMLVKSMAKGLGFSDVTPRVLRHSAVVEWFTQGIKEDAIQKRLGLKTPYAFRIYEPIFQTIRSSSEATSSG